MKGVNILRVALKTNGFFSLFSALLAILLSTKVNAVNEMTNGQPVNFAIQMVVFGAIVLFAGYSKKVFKVLVWVIIGMDILYVMLTSFNLAVAENLSPSGFALILFTTFLVLIFAVFQMVGIIKHSKSFQTNP
ncbi:hypothetical protein [Spongiimicrobium sp. 3-5]|uniref:hypothetical protein n=1 Tax=Spongiimicrobium sp. 3-5 TaxID=3332596 RepID=UPI00397FADB5